MRALMNATIALALILSPVAISGCDTVEEERKVEVKDDGTVVKETEKTTENIDGSVTKTEEKKVDKP
jgi:uncharacterized lipoprotein YehR (DUF1307 family)